MTVTFKTGNTYSFAHDDDVTICDGLPVGTYIVKFNKMKEEFYLEGVDSFSLPSKLYGDVEKRSKRILNTFMQRPLSTGVMLNGVKGSGKTLLAKHLSTLAQKHGIPTIVVNQPYGGDEFNAFVQSIDIPAIIMFDEFEKVYKWDKQEQVLTLLDGVFPSKKLFVVTTNESDNVNSYMKNRPGRIYYNFKFGTLDNKFIEEFCNDNLKNKDQIEDILQYTQVFNFFNFDMLAAAIEEMNRYDETLPQVLEVLNIQPETSNDDTYQMTITINGNEYLIDRNLRRFSPNTFNYTLWTDDDMPSVLSGDDKVKETILTVASSSGNGTDPYTLQNPSVEFGHNDIVNFDQVENKFTYEVEQGGHLIVMNIKRNLPTTSWSYKPGAF